MGMYHEQIYVHDISIFTYFMIYDCIFYSYNKYLSF